MAIKESGVQFDVIFGPAYKGIPLATSLSMAWMQLYGENKHVCYNRKEVKDHGEVRSISFNSALLCCDDILCYCMTLLCPVLHCALL